jgi:hypothetical protein
MQTDYDHNRRNLEHAILCEAQRMLFLAAARTALPAKRTRRGALESAASEDKECKEWRSRLLPNAVADYFGHRAISSSLCYVRAVATAMVQTVVKPMSFGA